MNFSTFSAIWSRNPEFTLLTITVFVAIQQKTEVLNNFFSSVFTVEVEFCCAATTCRPCHSPIEQLIFSEQTILDRLNKLKITKSQGPDGIHPRILYELWYELLEPLKILFDTSVKLGILPEDWKIGHIMAVYKKGNKSDPSNYRPIIV